MYVIFCFRSSAKPRQRQTRHSSQSTSSGSVAIPSSSAGTSDPSLGHDDPAPTSSNIITSSISATPPSGDMTSSGDQHAPQLLDLMRTSSGGTNPVGDDQSDASSVSSTQAQAGSPIQIEHSYALTFSSTAALLNDSEVRYRGIPSQATPLSSPQPTSVPVSVIRNTSPLVENFLPHLQDQRSGHGLGSSTTAGRANETRVLGESSEGMTHPQHNNSGRGNHQYNSGTTSPSPASSRTLLLDMEHNYVMPPYMLSSTEPNARYGVNRPYIPVPAAIMNLPTGHAQSNQSGTITAVGNESAPNFNVSPPPISGTFEVPEPVLLAHYPSGADVHVRATANGSMAGWTEREQQRLQNFITSHSRERSNASHERERQRLENSTAFIASHSRERVRASHRRARRRDRSGEPTQLPVEETSASGHGAQRDRSPTRSQSASQLISRSHRRRVRPTSHAVQTVPLPSLNLHVSRDFPVDPTSGTFGHQIVPQSSPVSVGVSSSGSLSSLFQPSPLQQIPLHAPHRHICVPATSNVQLRFQMAPRVSRNSSEPVVQLTSAQPDLLMSHSSSPFHPPPTSQSTTSTSSEPVSHSSTSLPISNDVLQVPLEQATSSREISAVDHELQTVPVESVPRRRQSHVEVIIVDSSDSEVRYIA